MPLLDSLGAMSPEMVQGVMLMGGLQAIQKYEQQQAKLGGGAKGGGGLDPQMAQALMQLFGGIGATPAPTPPGPMPPRYPAPSGVPGARPATALPPAPSVPRIAPVGSGA